MDEAAFRIAGLEKVYGEAIDGSSADGKAGSLPRHIATDEVSRHRRLARAVGTLMLMAGLTSGPAVHAQSSPVCEFAVATLAATQLELSSAKKSYRDCSRDGRNSCKVELARVRELQQRLKLSRSYLDRYCLR